MKVKTLQITSVTDSSACVMFQNRAPARARVFSTEVHNNLFIMAVYTQNIFLHFRSSSVFSWTALTYKTVKVNQRRKKTNL